VNPARRARRVAVLASAALLLTACDGGGAASGPQRLPDVTVAPLSGDGVPLDLATLTGPAVVNLWATWCVPCRRELPAFQDVSERSRDVAFIGIDIGDDPAAARAFLDRLGVTFPQYVDRDAAVTDVLGVASLPVTFVVDAAGGVVTHLGPMSTEELQSTLDGLG
jgi:cytochrome c biogenesis protein CcmG/thiol:disulfide interchange protein DsbE